MSKKSIMGTVFGSALGVAGGAFLVNEKVGKEKKRQKQLADKHLALLIMMCDWMRTKQEGTSLAIRELRFMG